MAVSKSVVYDKFGGGEFGNMSPPMAPDGTWTGTNCVVYTNGRIGPRPGLRHINITPSSPAKSGPMLGFGFSPVAQADDNTPIFFILEDRVYFFDPTDPELIAGVGTDLDEAPTFPILSKESVRLIGDELYITSDGDKSYKLNCRTQTVTPIADSPAGTDIELYRDRILISEAIVRIRYSAAADFDDWPVGNFFDVGAAYRIISLTEFRDALSIFTQSGTWVMTGTADDGTLRRVSETLSPLDNAVVKTNDVVIYIPSSRSAPVLWNGSQGDESSLQHLENWKPATARTVCGVQSYGNRDVLFMSNSNGKMLWRKNDAWTKHEIPISGIGPWITRWFDDNVVIAYPGTASIPPRFYMLSMTTERPAFASDTWARPGDNQDIPVEASFTLPDFRTEGGKECRVRTVTVDFYKYDTGADEDNNIDLVIEALSRENKDGNFSTTKEGFFREGVGEADTDGVLSRRVYRGTPGPWGGGYRLSLENIKGVAIERIVVEIEEQDSPHG